MNVTHCRHLRGGHTQMHAHTHYVYVPIPNVILPQQDLIYVFRCRWVFSLIYLTNRTCSTLELSGILQNKMDRSREERKGMECNSGRSHFLFRNLRCFFFKYFRRDLPLTSEIPQWFFFSPPWFLIPRREISILRNVSLKRRQERLMGPQTTIWYCYPLLLAILQIYWYNKRKNVHHRHWETSKQHQRDSGVPLCFMEKEP